MKIYSLRIVFLFCLACFIFTCSKESDHISIYQPALDDYFIEPGFDLEAIASEPLIKSPIAIDFDDRGRLWVLEMPGYMPNIDGTGEEEPVGRILIMEDSNQDGHYESAKVFLDQLVLARAMRLCYGGLLYAEPPNLWFVEIKNDQPGKKTLVDSVYAVGGNIEHQPNGLDLNIDNWIYSAKSTFRYRLKNGKWLKEATSFRGQWGISHDDEGRLFYNDNSNPLYGDYTLPNLFNQNPFFKNENGENEVIVPDRRVYPIQATAVNRGYVDGVLDENLFLKNFTSACGPVIYRGDNFPAGYKDNAFVCGPEVNLIKRLLIRDSTIIITGKQAYQGKEFLISKDEAFRPVNLYNGPDGALYIVDYHNGIIQHKVYMTAYLRELYLERGLDTIVNYGRILKVSQKQTEQIRLHGKSNSELVQFLSHPNGWVRDRAQQLLIHKNAKEVIPLLKDLARSESLHALWALEGLDALDALLLAALAESDKQSICKAAVQLAGIFYDHSDNYPVFRNALKHKNPEIDLQVCLTAGKVNEKAFVQIQEVLDRYPNDTLFIEAALSSLSGKEDQFKYFLQVVRGKPDSYPILNYLNQLIEKRKTAPEKTRIEEVYTDTKTVGLNLYRQHCAACHGEDGLGNKNLAPPIYQSEYLSGDPEKLVLLTLHGLQGPITIKGKRYELNAVMPGLKDNPELSDNDIANILSFVRNAFSEEPLDIEASQVKKARSKFPKGKMYTEAELLREGQ